MSHTLCAVKQQCALAANEMMGHGGWEKVETDVFADGASGAVVPLICALKDGQIFEASGEDLQKVLDEYFPVRREGTLEAFRGAWEEHRQTEAEYRKTWNT